MPRRPQMSLLTLLFMLGCVPLLFYQGWQFVTLCRDALKPHRHREN